jgi:hypothetical protein
MTFRLARPADGTRTQSTTDLFDAETTE